MSNSYFRILVAAFLVAGTNSSSPQKKEIPYSEQKILAYDLWYNQEYISRYEGALNNEEVGNVTRSYMNMQLQFIKEWACDFLIDFTMTPKKDGKYSDTPAFKFNFTTGDIQNNWKNHFIGNAVQEIRQCAPAIICPIKAGTLVEGKNCTLIGRQFQFMAKFWNLTGAVSTPDRSDVVIKMWAEVEASGDDHEDPSKRNGKPVRERRVHKTKPQ